jgi:Type II secretion system protein B
VFKQSIGLVLLAFMSLHVYAGAGLPDPTRPAYPDSPQAPVVNTDMEPKLSAIWFLPKSRWATINGVQAREGQSIDGNINVVKIRKNSVTITHNGIIKTLQLLARPLMFR